MHIVIVSGTNRSGALSLHLAKLAAEDHQALGATVDIIDLGESMDPAFLLPTAYKTPEPAVRAVVDRFLASDGVVFVVPEYNGSYPGVLKLFIDMLPYPQGFDQRPCAFIGLSAGQFASLRAVEHFQQVAGYRNAFQYPRRVLIANSFKQFSGDQLIDTELRQRLRDQADGFQNFIQDISG